MKISQKYLDFNSEANVFVPYASTNKTHLKLDTSLTDKLTTDLETWNAQMALYLDPSTHYNVIIAIADAYDTLHPEIQSTKTMIKKNTLITLTNDDYLGLYIHQDAERRTHVPAPKVEPVNVVVKQIHLVTSIFTSNPTPPHEKETKLPDDVVKISRKIAFAAANATTPPTPDMYHNIESIGNTVYDICFSTANVGTTAYLITSYLNYRGETGPDSVALSFPVI